MTCHKCHWIELNRGHLDYVTCTLTIWLRLSILKAVISRLWKKVGVLLCTDQSEYCRFVLECLRLILSRLWKCVSCLS